MYYLIRSNIEDEGWTNDGIFAEKEAREQLAAMLRSAQIAEHEGHHFEFSVYLLDENRGYPVQMIASTENGYRVFRESGLRDTKMNVPLPPALDY